MIRQLHKFKIQRDVCKREESREFESEHVYARNFQWNNNERHLDLCPECHLKALREAADKAAKDFADAALKAKETK